MSRKINSEFLVTIFLLTGLALFLILYCVSSYLFPGHDSIMFSHLKFFAQLAGTVLYALIVVALVALGTSIIEISSSGRSKRNKKMKSGRKKD